uniref:Phosphatase and actin regulator n=2 Tax=Haplochromini TaxID=319058 RepID=A0A3B4FLB2_9CICH
LPPATLKAPAAFHEQIRSLERARTGTFLKHKLCSRPGRSELVRMHILQETHAEPSLQATQMKLKRARLTDDLNEKIAQRPGPMELVEKNILPVDPGVEEVNNGRASLLLLYLFTTYSECSEGNSNQLCSTSGGFLSIFNDVLSLFGKQSYAASTDCLSLSPHSSPLSAVTLCSL